MLFTAVCPDARSFDQSFLPSFAPAHFHSPAPLFLLASVRASSVRAVLWLPKMFVPKAAARNPRRRQRTSSDDSVKPPKAKRQRSVLRQAGDSPSTNLDRSSGRDPAESAAPILINDLDVSPDLTGADSHLPIRNAKPSEGSRTDLDGAIVLVSRLSCMIVQTKATNAIGSSQAQITIPSTNFRLCQTKFEVRNRVNNHSLGISALGLFH